MLVCSRFLSFGVKTPHSLSSEARVLSSLANSIPPVTRGKPLPEGISVEVLNESHDIYSLRKHLARSFVLNNEPVIHALCQRYYSRLSTKEQLLQVEKTFERLYPDESLRKKIREGLSVVAVKDEKPKRYVGLVFAESYKGDVYKDFSLVEHTFFSEGFRLMQNVHQAAIPFLSSYSAHKIAFLSHAATCPEFRSIGILESCLDHVFLLLKEKEFELAYCITTPTRLVRFLTRRFQYDPIAVVAYKNYQVNGQKVFANLADDAATAMVKFLT